MPFEPTLNKFGVPLDGSAVGILMPKLKYKYRVTMTNFGNEQSATDLTRQVVTAARPNIQHNRTELHSYNNVVFIPQKPVWQSVEIVVRDDITNSVSYLVATQLQKQMNHFDQTSPIAGINFKFNTQIETFDGSHDDAGIIENWYLEGCFLETVSYDTFDYSSSEAMQITLTISYDNATQDRIIMDDPLLTTGSNPARA